MLVKCLSKIVEHYNTLIETENIRKIFSDENFPGGVEGFGV